MKKKRIKMEKESSWRKNQDEKRIKLEGNQVGATIKMNEESR